MLLHLVPRVISRYKKHNDIQIIEYSIEKLGLSLFGDTDLRICRPYTNKNYHVPMRKGNTRKAVQGILIMTKKREIREFTAIARWKINDRIAVHTVHYNILDEEYPAISDDASLWCGGFDGFSPRKPDMYKGKSVVQIERRFDAALLDKNDNWVVEQEDDLSLPTLERERVLNGYSNMAKIPPLQTAFIIK